jgi:hypothetical protein
MGGGIYMDKFVYILSQEVRLVFENTISPKAFPKVALVSLDGTFIEMVHI